MLHSAMNYTVRVEMVGVQVVQLERNDGALDIGNICKRNRKNIYTK